MAAIDPTGLRKAMEGAGYTSARLAAEAGISRTYLADVMSGRRTLKRNPELRHSIAKILDVPFRWIENNGEAS